jgi:SET family sugar efflux transporter-like MFS transporter
LIGFTSIAQDILFIMRALKTAPQTLEEANFHHFVLDIVWFGLALPATTRFLQIYAIHLGAGATELGWMTMLPAIILLFSASLGSRWMARHNHDSSRAVFWPALGFRLQFLLPALTPFMPKAFQPTWLILSLALPALPQGLSSVAFLVMLRETIPERRITSLLCRRSIAMNVAVGLSGLALGAWLNYAPFPLNYQVMFAAAFILTLVSLWHVAKVHIAPTTAPKPIETESHINPWRSPKFQQVAFITAVIHIGFFSVFPLTPLHLVDHLHADEFYMSVYALAELAAGAFVAIFIGRMATRISNRSMIAIAMIGTSVGSVLVAIAPNLYFALPAAAIIGGSWTAAGIALLSYFSESTPAEGRAKFTVAYSQVVYLATFLGPMIGTGLRNAGINLVAVILIGALLRFAAASLTQFHAFEWMGRTLRIQVFTR